MIMQYLPHDLEFSHLRQHLTNHDDGFKVPPQNEDLLAVADEQLAKVSASGRRTRTKKDHSSLEQSGDKEEPADDAEDKGQSAEFINVEIQRNKRSKVTLIKGKHSSSKSPSKDADQSIQDRLPMKYRQFQQKALILTLRSTINAQQEVLEKARKQFK